MISEKLIVTFLKIAVLIFRIHIAGLQILLPVLTLIFSGSIPGGVTGFFSDIFPSDRTMALGSTQPLLKMSTRTIAEGKGGRCVRLTTSPPSCAECHENLVA